MAMMMERTAGATMDGALADLRELARRLDAESCLIHLELVERTLRGKLALTHGAMVVAPALLAERALVPTAADVALAFERPAATMFLASYDTPRVVGGRTLSRYQANILHFVEHEAGDGIVGAVAGSGKTTTLEMAARAIRGEALFLAFNASIAKELAGRLAGTSMAAKTIHSVGMGALTKAFGKVKVDEYKYRDLADREAARILPPGADRKSAAPLARMLLKLADFARLTLTDPRDAGAMWAMADRYNVEVPGGTPEAERLAAAVFEAVARVIDAGTKLATGAAHAIDFTDMIYLPVALDLTPAQAAWVFVDECQDLNKAQLELVLKTRAAGGRMLFVGDDRQAIYGFAGADSDSFWTIHRRTGATLMALSVCYRCPTAVLDLARQIVPEIEAAPGAPAGTVGYVAEDKLHEQLRAGDLVLCRLTAPLVSLCLDLIGRKMAAKVRGREIGAQITAIVRKVTEQHGYTWETFGEQLGLYAAAQSAKLANRPDAENALQAMEDKVAAVRACFESFDATGADHLCALIDGLFAGDNERGAIILSTVHRAKGLEERRVYILKPEKLPLVWPKQTEEEAAQETNLRYVAITRAKEALYFVESAK
jgi:DNA helicase-2/ATP-dependent DNA helicase PcrA